MQHLENLQGAACSMGQFKISLEGIPMRNPWCRRPTPFHPTRTPTSHIHHSLLSTLLPKICLHAEFLCVFTRKHRWLFNCFLSLRYSMWTTAKTTKLRPNCVIGSKIKVPTSWWKASLLPTVGSDYSDFLILYQLSSEILTLLHYPSLFLPLPRWSEVYAKPKVVVKNSHSNTNIL